MSSEEMRNELESFVNKGIREGWRGWPLKNWSFDCEGFRLTCCAEARGIGTLSRFRERFSRPTARLSPLFLSDFEGADSLS